MWETEKDKKRIKKTTALGIKAGPMASSTVALTSLSVDDALNLVDRKIRRAIDAHADEIKVVLPRDFAKLQKKLTVHLESHSSVSTFWPDEANGLVWHVKLILH